MTLKLTEIYKMLERKGVREGIKVIGILSIRFSRQATLLGYSPYIATVQYPQSSYLLP